MARRPGDSGPLRRVNGLSSGNDDDNDIEVIGGVDPRIMATARDSGFQDPTTGR